MYDILPTKAIKNTKCRLVENTITFHTKQNKVHKSFIIKLLNNYLQLLNIKLHIKCLNKTI